MSFRPPNPGVLVDNKYRLAERIGGGGMGDVFRAENVLAGRPVAIKFLHPELAQNTELSQRFFQEAQAVNRVRHPNVVDVLDAGVGEMGPYIVMEYLDGESVGAALVRVSRFDVEAAVGTAIPVLEALDAAHRVGIIHRDLKPENVFIAFDAARSTVLVRLLDFGIAKMLDTSGPSPRTRTGVVFGTPDYLSPEQATGEAPLDGRSDLFAVGVLLYELVTGARPFRAPTAVATAFKVVHAEAPSLAAAGVHVDQRLEGVVTRLLQKDPAKRYPVASDVIRDLDRVVPDPARRIAALSRVLGVSRRLSLPGSGYETPASPRDPGSPRRAIEGSSTQTTGRAHQAFGGGRGVDDASSGRAGSLASGSSLPYPRAEAHPKAPESPPQRISEVFKTPWPAGASDLPKTIRSATLGEGGADSARPTIPAPIRPFPHRFAGRFQVRGPVLRSVDRVLRELFGGQARDAIVAHMPEIYASDLRNDSINALVAYDLEGLDAYMEHATVLMGIDAAKWREIGRLAVDGELNTMVKSLLRPAQDIAAVMKRGVSIWARLFSFGAWRVTPTSTGKVAVHVAEFDAVPHPLRCWIAGMIEQTARRAVRPDVRLTITAGEQEFTPELGCELG